jgi:F-type H+-transporting ATPase subunit epsilon
MALQVELVSPEDIVFTGQASMVVARTPEGDIAFQPGHVPFIGTLAGRGPVKIFLVEGGVMQVAVHSGFVQVANDVVSILSDVAELPEAIDVARAEAARDRARAALAVNVGDEDAQAALDRAELRLTVAGTAGARAR